MTDPNLRTLIGLAGRPDAPLDLPSLAGRLRRRRRRRRAGQALASLMAIVVVVAGAQTVIWGGDDVTRTDLATRSEALVPIDPQVDAVEGLPSLTAAALSVEPTRLPDGYRRCSGPTDSGTVSVTTYCAEGSPPLSLTRGPHAALPEVGQQVPVADRVGYVRRHDGQVEMTVSDDNGAQDRHHRLQAPAQADLQAGDLAAILASVPAVAQAPPPTGR